MERVVEEGSASSPTRPSRRERWSLSTDPFRIAIASCLVLRPMSAAEIAAEIGAEPERVRHQLRRMVAGGFAATVGKTRRRGVAETLYSSSDLDASIFSKEDLAAIGPEPAEQLFLRVGALMWKEAKASLEEGLMASWPHSHMARIPLALDRQGWTAANDVLVAAMEAIAALHDGSVVDDAVIESSTEARISLVLTGIAERPTRVSEASDPTPGTEADARDGHRIELASGNRWKHATTTTRIQILSILSLTPLTAAGLANRLPIPLQTVRGELRRLLKLGLVQVHRRRIKGRTVEYTYAVDPARLVMTAEEREALTPARRRQMHLVVVSTIFSELIGSIQDGTASRCEDSVILRIPILADDRLAVRIGQTLVEAFESLMGIRSDTIARLRASGEPATLATASILFYPASR